MKKTEKELVMQQRKCFIFSRTIENLNQIFFVVEAYSVHGQKFNNWHC